MIRTHCIDCGTALQQRRNSRRKRCDPCGKAKNLQNGRAHHKRRQAINAAIRAACRVDEGRSR